MDYNADIKPRLKRIRELAIETWDIELSSDPILDEDVEVARRDFELAVDGYLALFDKFGLRDPNAFNDMIANVRSAKNALQGSIVGEDGDGYNNSVASRLGYVKNQVEDWKGEAAWNFATEYLPALEESISIQYSFAAELEAAYTAARDIVKNSQKDALLIAELTLVALGDGEIEPEYMDSYEKENPNPDMLAVAGTVLGIASGIVGAVIAPQFGAMEALGLLSSAVGAAQAGADIDKVDIHLPKSGASIKPPAGEVETIIYYDMPDCLSALETAINDEEQALSDALSYDSEYLSMSMDKIVLVDPVMVGSPDSTFYPPGWTP